MSARGNEDASMKMDMQTNKKSANIGVSAFFVAKRAALKLI